MLGRNLIASAAGNAAEAEVEWDIANASFDGTGQNFLNILDKETNISAITFKTNGAKMYIIGSGSRAVNEYNLSTAWDVSTATFLQSFSVASQELSPEGVFFRNDGSSEDGKQMYVIGSSGDDINEYDLTTAWDVSTASYSQNFSISSEESVPTGLFFRNDGRKVYIVGTNGDEVNEYDIDTAWDISTASYNQTFSVSAQDTTPRGVFFRNDGTSEDGKQMYIAGDAGNDINEYSLTTAWDISTASYVRRFSISSLEANPSDVFFKSDGSKMFVCGYAQDTVYQLSLSTDWNISTASYSAPTTDYASVSSQETNPQALFFKGDGSKMYVMGSTGDDINEYSLSTAWNVHSATFSQAESISAQETSPAGLFFRNDGTSEDGKQMYVVGSSGDDVNEYSLSTAWDVSTASYTQNFSVSSESAVPVAVSFKSDGSKMFILDGNNRTIFRYSLSTDWNISTASYDGSAYNFSVVSQELSPNGLFFRDNGKRMYICGASGDDVNQYDLSVAWDVSSASFDTNFSISSLSPSTNAIFFKPDGAKFFTIDSATDSVAAFTIS